LIYYWENPLPPSLKFRGRLNWYLRPVGFAPPNEFLFNTPMGEQTHLWVSPGFEKGAISKVAQQI